MGVPSLPWSSYLPLQHLPRLDQPAVGILPLALGSDSGAAFHFYTAQWAGRLVSNEYQCLCEFGAGKAMSAKVGTSSAVLDPIRPIVTLESSFVAESNRGRKACTHYVAISTFYNNKTSTSMALMKVHPLTERTLQIRVHLASISLPLVGEQKYRCLGAQGPSWCN